MNKILIKNWNSIDDILKKYPNFDRKYIMNCCTGYFSSAYGYLWKYETNNNQNIKYSILE